jgi:hypothetical protein
MITEELPIKDQRRGWMLVYYPARRSLFQRFINWLERMARERRDKKN